MPSKYVIRSLKSGGMYHVFNAGSDSRGLFGEDQDFRVFLFYLYIYTSPIEEVVKKFSDLPTRLRKKTLNGKLEILAYALMPDHFHLVVRQHQADGMPKLMKQVINGYTAYFNQKHGHKGPAFAGRYKAIEIIASDVPDVVRYIHNESQNQDNPWSSYASYLRQESPLGCDTSLIMDIFGTREGLINFHNDANDYSKSLERIKSPVCLT